MNKTTDKTRQEDIRIRNITNRNITPNNGDNSVVNFSFNYKLFLLRNGSNKIGILVNAFKDWHTEAPVEDYTNLGSRLAGICKTINNDYGYLLELLWISVPRSPNGSHLNYIQGIINLKKLKDKQKPMQQQAIRNFITPDQLREENKKLAEERDANKQKVNNDTTG